MYADDTSISFSLDSIPDINNNLSYDRHRLKSDKLSLNVTKTQTILIGG